MPHTLTKSVSKMELQAKRKGPKPKPLDQVKTPKPAYATPKQWETIEKKAFESALSVSEFLIFKALQ